MATIYDDLVKIKEKKREAKEGFLKKAARFVLPKFIEEPLFGKKEEEKRAEIKKEKTIYDDLLPKEKRVKRELETEKPEYYTIPGTFASFPFPETIAKNNISRVDNELKRANTELEELRQKQKEAPLGQQILMTFLGPAVKPYREVANKELEISRLEGERKSWEKQVTYEKETKTLFGKAVRHATAGFGDTIYISGRTMQWLGAEEIGKEAMEIGEEYQRRVIPPVNPDDFTWKNVADPEWYVTNVMRSVPFTLSLIPATLIALDIAGVGAAWAGLGKFATFMLQVLGAGTASRAMESSLEAGGVYDDMLRKGMSEEEASKAAEETFKGNMALVGLDVAQFALAFTPLRYFGTGKPMMRRILSTGIKVVGVGLSEGGEEAYQDIIQRKATGEEIKVDPRMKESFAIGAIFGVGLGGAGSVWTSLNARIEKDMPSEMKKEFDKNKSEELAKGSTEQQAQLSALNNLADTPEGQNHIEQVIENLKTIASEIEPLPLRQIKPAEVSARVIERVLAGEEALRMSPKGRELLKTQLIEQERIGPDVRLEKQVENIVNFILSKPEAQRSVAEVEIVDMNEELVAEAEKIQGEEIPIVPDVEPVPKEVEKLDIDFKVPARKATIKNVEIEETMEGVLKRGNLKMSETLKKVWEEELGFVTHSDVKKLAEEYGNFNLLIKDVNGQRALVPVSQYVEWIKSKAFRQRIRSVFINKSFLSGFKTDIDKDFMEELQEGGKIVLRIGEAPKIQKIEGIDLVNEAEVSPRGVVKFVDALSNEDVRDALQIAKIKRVEIHPPFRFSLSEQAHIVKKDKLIRINADATDPTQTIFHEIGHLAFDNLNAQQKKSVEKILRDNKIGIGYLKNNKIEEAFADNLFTKKVLQDFYNQATKGVKEVKPEVKPELEGLKTKTEIDKRLEEIRKRRSVISVSSPEYSELSVESKNLRDKLEKIAIKRIKAVTEKKELEVKPTFDEYLENWIKTLTPEQQKKWAKPVNQLTNVEEIGIDRVMTQKMEDYEKEYGVIKAKPIVEQYGIRFKSVLTGKFETKIFDSLETAEEALKYRESVGATGKIVKIPPKKVLTEKKALVTKPKAKPIPKEEFKVGDVFEVTGNMVSPATIRKIEGNSLYFTDAKGTDYSGVSRSTVRNFIKEGVWKRVEEAEPVEKPKLEVKKIPDQSTKTLEARRAELVIKESDGTATEAEENEFDRINAELEKRGVLEVPEDFETFDTKMSESEDNLIEPETDEEYQEGFEAEGKEKAVFDDKSQVFHSTETKTEVPDPETRDRVSALKEPRSQLGYVYHLIRTNQIIPEDLRWIVDARNEEAIRQIGEREILEVKEKPGMYKMNYIEDMITQDGIDSFYPAEEYKDITDYKQLQEGWGVEVGEWKENKVVKFTDETGERLGRLVDIFDNGKAIVEVSTGEIEVDFWSLKVPAKLTKAQEKIAERVFPEEKIEKEFELTTDFMEKKGIKPKPKPKAVKKPTDVAPKRNIESKIFDYAKIFTSKRNLPILGNVAIKGSKIMATDLEIGITYESGKDVGNLTLDPENLKGKSIEEIKINQKEKTAQIGALKVKGISIDEFPLIPEVKVEPQFQTLHEPLIDALNKTVKLINISTPKPEISGLLIKNENKKVRFTSTDSIRLYQFSFLAKILKDFEALIPKKSVEKILRIIKQVKPGLISVAVDSKKSLIQFEFGKFKVVSRLIEGKYPDYKELIPKKMANQVTIDREELLSILNEAPKTRQNEINLKLDEKNKKIIFSAKDKEEGISFTKEIDVTFAKKPAEISVDENYYVLMPIQETTTNLFAYNKDFLKDFLKTTKADQIEMLNIAKKDPLILREKLDILEDFIRESSKEYGDNTFKELKKPPILRKSNISLKLKEVGRFYTNNLHIESSNDVADIFSELKRESREKVFVLNLTKDNKIINAGLISIGAVDQAMVTPLEVMKPILASKAKKVYFIHNHPSADVGPSESDISMMTRLREIFLRSGVEFEGGVIINHVEYGFVGKDFSSETISYVPRVKLGKEISVVEMEQIINSGNEFVRDGVGVDNPTKIAKYFSEMINPDVPVMALINLNSRNNIIGYEIIGHAFKNTGAAIKKISKSITKSNSSQVILTTNIPFNKVTEERVLEIERFLKLFGVDLLDVVLVKKNGNYESYKSQGKLRRSNTGVSENIANYDEFSAEERAVIKAIQEGAPVPVDLIDAVKSLQNRGVIQTAEKKRPVKKERPPKAPRVSLKVGERISQRGITISHSSIVAKRPYLISYKVGDKRVVRSFENYDDAARRFDIMVEIRSKGFLKRGELPESIQSTKEQKAQAHIIAQKKKIGPRQYKRLAIAYTGVDSMTKMIPEQAQEFITALKTLIPKFGGKITIPVSKEVVTQEEAETKFRDITFGWLINIFRTPANVFRKIGVERQATPLFKGFELRRDFTNKWFADFKRWQRELDIRGILFKKKKIAEQSKRMFRAINNPDETVELSEKEALIVTRARIATEEIANLVDDARAEVGLEPMNRRNDYITNLLTELSHFILQKTKQAPNELYALLDLRLPSSIFDRLLLERKGGLPIKEDFWAAMKAMVQVHGKYIFLNPPVHRFERFMRFYGDKVPVLSRVYMRSRINRYLGRPGIIDRFLRGVDEAITQTISKIPGLRKEVEVEWQNGVTEILEVPRFVAPKIAQKSLRTLKSIRYVYDLAFSVSFYTINLTQFWLNTVPKLRGNFLNIYQSAFSGYAQMMVDFFRPSKWAYWRERGVLTEIDNVIDQEYGMGRGGANILNLFAKLSEFNNRVASALATEKNLQLLARRGKFETLYKELNSSFGEEAEAYARHIADITQFRYGVEQKPIFFDNPITDLYYQYNTFALKQIEFTEEIAKNLEAKDILKDFRKASQEGKTKEFVANLTQGQRGEFIRFIVNAFVLAMILGHGYVWEAIFKGMVPNQFEGTWKVLKGYWTGDRKLRQQGYRQVLLPPSWDLIEKLADYGIKATVTNAKAIKQLDLLRISITGEGIIKTIEGKKKEEITRGVAVTRLFKSYREKTALINSEGWDLYLKLSRSYDNTREEAIELIKKEEKQKARELAREYNKEAKEDLRKLKELEVTDLRLQENIKRAKKSKVVSVEDFNRWVKEAKEF